MELTREVLEALGAPFPTTEIEFLPRATSNGKAMAIAYIDARAVMRRLDYVVGPAEWSFDYDLLPSGEKSVYVKGRLTVCGVTKADAGEGEREEEPLKSAVSDALKRCGVHFGIGRYLYYLPKVWTPYDAQKRQFTETPRMPSAAIEHALQVCAFAPAPQRRPESRGDAQASQADHSSAGRGEREELRGKIEALFVALHPGEKFKPWASEVLKREDLPVLAQWDFADMQAAYHRLTTEKALHDSGKAGAPPPDTSALRQGL